jgi:hypothetical protein
MLNLQKLLNRFPLNIIYIFGTRSHREQGPESKGEGTAILFLQITVGQAGWCEWPYCHDESNLHFVRKF